MNKVIILLIFSFIFLSISGSVFADSSAFLNYSTSSGSCGGSNCDFGRVIDGSIFTNSSPGTLVLSSPAQATAHASNPLTLNFNFSAANVSTSNNHIRLDFTDNLSNLCYSTNASIYPDISGSTVKNVSFSVPGSSFTNNCLGTSGLKSTSTMTYVYNSGGDSVKIDGISIQYVWNSFLNLSNVVASASGGVTFDASGDTNFTGTNEQCTVKLFELDTSNALAPAFLTQAFATIFLDAANPRTTTLNQGGGLYLGQNFTSTSSIWTAKNIQAPFFSGKNVTISASTTCTHQTVNADGSLSAPQIDLQNQGYLPSLSTPFDPSLNATPSALQNTSVVYGGQCNSIDVICSFEQWLTTAFCTVFCPNTSYDAEQFSLLKDNLNSRVPFAYINTVFSTDFSNTATSTAMPAFTIPFPTISVLGITTVIPPQTYNFPSNVTDAIATIRPYLNYGLYASLIGYFLYLAHSIW